MTYTREQVIDLVARLIAYERAEEGACHTPDKDSPASPSFGGYLTFTDDEYEIVAEAGEHSCPGGKYDHPDNKYA